MTTLSISGTRGADGLGAALGRLASFLRGFAERGRALRELEQLTDRELADIGLSRSQVPDAVSGRGAWISR